jgi:hypothetical protein
MGETDDIAERILRTERAGLLHGEDGCLIIEQRRIGLRAPGAPPRAR